MFFAVSGINNQKGNDYMSPPITAQEINNRLSARSIRMLSDHAITKSKAEFTCKNNHTWWATINSVLKGNGCPHCALHNRKTGWKETLIMLLLSKKVELVGEYRGNQVYTEFRCTQCSKTWSGRPIVVKKVGCAFCNGRKIDTDIVNKRIREKGLTLTTEFTSTGDNGTFQCAEGHEWTTVISNVLHNKSGCPRCAKYGFNPDLPSYCYVICYPDYIKFGITNDWTRRRAEHIKTKGHFIRAFIKEEAMGNEALLWENTIKSIVTCGIVDSTVCKDGWTETTTTDNLFNVVDETFTEIYDDAALRIF